MLHSAMQRLLLMLALLTGAILQAPTTGGGGSRGGGQAYIEPTLLQASTGRLAVIVSARDSEAARHAVRTPGAPERLTLGLDESGRSFAADGGDVAFLHAELRDADGTLVPDAWENVSFGATRDIELTGANPYSSEAGIASILAHTEERQPKGTVYALSLARDGERVHILSASLAIGGQAETFEVRATTDGSDPETGAVHRAGPAIGAERVRAALFVDGRRIVEADTESPRFRIAGSTAP